MIYKIEPVFSEKIWGGDKLKKIYGFDIPSNKTGEAWMISGYKGNASRVVGEDIGLNEFYEKNPHLFNNYPQKEFPLLVKILDAENDLSIQVHPNNEQAMRINNYPMGKSECWVVLDVKKDGKIIVGHNANDKQELSEMFLKSDWKSFIKEVNIKKGDVFNIDPGTVHAIKGGTLIYELQQSSDITYRIYDYDRLENGKKRDLHLKESEEVITFSEKNVRQNEKTILSKEGIEIVQIVENDKFFLEKWVVDGNSEISLEKNRNFLVVTAITGKVKLGDIEIMKGQNAIITVKALNSIHFKGKALLYVGYPR